MLEMEVLWVEDTIQVVLQVIMRIMLVMKVMEMLLMVVVVVMVLKGDDGVGSVEYKMKVWEAAVGVRR